MNPGKLLRGRHRDDEAVRSIELFFDLVYVLAIGALAHHLSGQLNWEGVGEASLLLLVVWLAWNYSAWFTNYFDPDRLSVRLLLLSLMVFSLAMSGSVLGAFGNDGLLFALSYVAIQLVRTIFAVIALRGHPLQKVFLRPLVWWSLTALLWIAGGIAHDHARTAVWIIAMAIDILGVTTGFPVPRLGAAHTSEYTITGAHMAERCGLFVILALGEAILMIGSDFAVVLREWASISAFAVGFVGSAALWWIYFEWGAPAGARKIARTDDPGRFGVAAMYLHLPIVAGIIVTAVAERQVIEGPNELASAIDTSLILSGYALYLLGSMWYVQWIDRRMSWHRLAGLMLLGALASGSSHVDQLTMFTLATLIMVGVAALDTLRTTAGKEG